MSIKFVMIGFLSRVCRLAVVGLAIFAGSLSADDLTRAEQIQRLYDHSGIDAHLVWVQSTVLDESKAGWDICPTPESQIIIKETLASILSVDVLRKDFTQELDERIDAAALEKIVNWIDSDAGKRFYTAEADSIEFDEAILETKIAAYQNSGAHDEARVKKLRRLLEDTGAVYFLSAMNTELAALASMASVCSNDADRIAVAAAQIKDDRGAEALYRSFMRQGLVLPAGVIYQDIADVDFDAYSAFAQSDAGRDYFTALIQGIRRVLEGKVEALQLAIESASPTH